MGVSLRLWSRSLQRRGVHGGGPTCCWGRYSGRGGADPAHTHQPQLNVVAGSRTRGPGAASATPPQSPRVGGARRAPGPDWPLMCESGARARGALVVAGEPHVVAAGAGRAQQCSGAGPGACGARGPRGLRTGTARPLLAHRSPAAAADPLAAGEPASRCRVGELVLLGGRACPSVSPPGVGRVRLCLCCGRQSSRLLAQGNLAVVTVCCRLFPFPAHRPCAPGVFSTLGQSPLQPP